MSCGQLWELLMLPTVGDSMFSLLSADISSSFLEETATCVTSNLYYWPRCEKFAKITLKVGGCNNSYSTDPCWKYVSVLNPKWASKLSLSLSLWDQMIPTCCTHIPTLNLCSCVCSTASSWGLPHLLINSAHTILVTKDAAPLEARFHNSWGKQILSANYYQF
jgi:hypothetical protein